MTIEVIEGDNQDVMRGLVSKSFRAIITSPMYWGYKDSSVDINTIGRESTLADYIIKLTNVFRTARRLLTDDGTLWIVHGDIQAGVNPGNGKTLPVGIGPNDLIGGPIALVDSLVRDGWILQRDYIWEIPTERDPFDIAIDHIFMFSNTNNFFFNEVRFGPVWKITPDVNPELPTFPEELVESCILSSTEEEDTVLDFFCGLGTVGVVAKELNRKTVLIDISNTYVKKSIERIG